MNRSEFEEWYVKTYMAMMVGGIEEIKSLRNGDDYDNDHISGAWSAWKLHQVSAEITVRVSAAQAFVFVTSLMAVTGLLYFICFSQDFYNFVMMFS